MHEVWLRPFRFPEKASSSSDTRCSSDVFLFAHAGMLFQAGATRTACDAGESVCKTVIIPCAFQLPLYRNQGF